MINKRNIHHKPIILTTKRRQLFHSSPTNKNNLSINANNSNQ